MNIRRTPAPLALARSLGAAISAVIMAAALVGAPARAEVDPVARGLAAKALSQNTWPSIAQMVVDTLAGSAKLQNNAAANTLTIRNASASGWAAIAFTDASASNSGAGKERLAIGYYNPTDASGFSAGNYIETSNDPQAGVTTNAPTPLRIVQTGYLNSVYQVGTPRLTFESDGTIKIKDWNGNLIAQFPLLNTSPSYINYKLQMGGTGSSNLMLWANGSTLTLRAADDSGAAGMQAFSYGVGGAGFLSKVSSGALQILNAAGSDYGSMAATLPGTTVASLPSCTVAREGLQYVVTDANATTFHSTVAAGGSNHVKVVCLNTAWAIGG